MRSDPSENLARSASCSMRGIVIINPLSTAIGSSTAHGRPCSSTSPSRTCSPSGVTLQVVRRCPLIRSKAIVPRYSQMNITRSAGGVQSPGIRGSTPSPTAPSKPVRHPASIVRRIPNCGAPTPTPVPFRISYEVSATFSMSSRTSVRVSIRCTTDRFAVA